MTDNASPMAMSATPAPIVFEPGPSFNELPAVALESNELPGWLQDFAGTVSDPEIPAGPSAEAEVVSPDTSALPNWLTEPRAEASVAAAPAGWSMAADKFDVQDDGGFISEDDLPEWLRAISLDPTDAAASTAAPLGVNGAGATATLQTPAVVNAWIVSRQTVALAAGESLFANIASEEPRPAADMTEADSQPALAGAPAPVPVAQPAVVSVPAKEQATNLRARQRRYVLYLLLMLALVLLIFMLKN